MSNTPMLVPPHTSKKPRVMTKAEVLLVRTLISMELNYYINIINTTNAKRRGNKDNRPDNWDWMWGRTEELQEALNNI